MEIILKEDIGKLGHKDDIVTVKNGYARNYLIPQGKAIAATSSDKKMLEETLRQRSHKEAKVTGQASKVLADIKAATIKVGAKVGENGKIFGSVTNVQVADAIKKLGYEIERKNITINGDAIKSIGNYTAELKLHKSVSGTIEFEVLED